MKQNGGAIPSYARGLFKGLFVAVMVVMLNGMLVVSAFGAEVRDVVPSQPVTALEEGDDELALQSATIVVAQQCAGDFTVEVRGLNDVSSGRVVTIAIWCIDANQDGVADSNDQDDLVWHTASYISPGRWRVTATTAEHLNQQGTYAFHVYVSGENAARVGANALIAASEVPVYRLYNPNSSEHLYTTDVNERNVLYNEYGWGYEGTSWNAPSIGTPVYRLYNSGLSSHLYTSDENEVSVLTKEHGWQLDNNGNPLFYSGCSLGVYRVYNPELNGMHHLTTSLDEYAALPEYGWEQEGVSCYASSMGDLLPSTHYYPGKMDGYSIMGTSTMTASEMVSCYNNLCVNAGRPYPSSVYSKYGASTIDQFCAILVNEAETEGVRAEVVFAQAMWETGWLQFSGSDVKPEQCNFAGLGVYGGSSGLDFSSYGSSGVRMGFRYQIQLLKAYASTDPLVNPCICPTFTAVDNAPRDGSTKYYRGCAPTLQDLDGIWAGEGYGDTLEGFINYLKSNC